MTKRFKLSADDIQQLIPNMGGCLATDKITVDGRAVDYMVRSEPRNETDSGWVFYGGGETQEYLDDANNTSIYGLNTIANYDPEIIPFLTYPPGTEIERGEDGEFRVMTANVPSPDMVIMYPAGPGKVRITQEWSFNLSERMFRRVDEGSLVLWRDGITIWINCYGPTDTSVSERVDEMAGQRSKDAYGYEQVDTPALTKCRYWLEEPTDDGKTQASAYVLAFGGQHTMNMAVYFDTDALRAEVDGIWNSVESSPG